MPLTLCLEKKQDISWTTCFDENHRANFRQGGITDTEINDIFTRMGVAEFYQGICISTIREGNDVDVFITLPNVIWFSMLLERLPIEIKEVSGSKDLHRIFKACKELHSLPAGTM